MKLDTGADITAIPEAVYHRLLRSSPTLVWPDRVLRGPDKRQLPVLGSFRTSLTVTLTEDRLPCYRVYIVQGLQQPLLGHPEIRALGLLTQTDAINASCLTNADAPKRFPCYSLVCENSKVHRTKFT